MIHDNVLELIGDTPLVRLNRIAGPDTAEVIVKIEAFNPGGSVKDRIGLRIVEDAEEKGILKPGGTIVEATSGNTGAGLALAAIHKGYKAIFVMPDKMSDEKVNYLKALGAQVFTCPTAVEPEDPRSYYSVSKRLAEETPNAILANQYHNPVNPLTHYEGTGPELWRQTEGKIDFFVAGMGTGGTISGTGRYLKEQNPDLKVVGVDVEGSILKEYFETGEMGEAHPYLVEGVGEDMIPGTINFDVIDEIVMVGDKESFVMARRLSREEGIFVGGSCGSAVAGAMQIARREGPGKRIVVLLPDSGSRYLSTFHGDEWMMERGFVDPETTTVGDVLGSKAPGPTSLVSAEPSETVRTALERMREEDVSQMPVLRGRRGRRVAGRRSADVPRAGGHVASGVRRERGDGRSLPDGRPRRSDGGGAEPAVAATRRGAGDGERDHRGNPHAVRFPEVHPRRVAMGFSTDAVHGGQEPDPRTGAVIPPIYQTSTYAQEHLGEERDYHYARGQNPTREALERNLAVLEDAAHAVAFASGMAAVDAAVCLADAGEHILLSDRAYGGTYRLLDRVRRRHGIAFDRVPTHDPDAVRRAVRPETRALFVETPANPTLELTDLRAAAALCREHGLRLIVDNTFLSPYFQRPLEHGADLVVHSATKYLNGHSDVIGGAVMTRDPALAERLRFFQYSAGAVPGPFDCWLVFSGD